MTKENNKIELPNVSSEEKLDHIRYLNSQVKTNYKITTFKNPNFEEKKKLRVKIKDKLKNWW